MKFKQDEGKELIIILKNLDDIPSDVNYLRETFRANDKTIKTYITE